jgi:hypothetical protein
VGKEGGTSQQSVVSNPAAFDKLTRWRSRSRSAVTRAMSGLADSTTGAGAGVSLKPR